MNESDFKPPSGWRFPARVTGYFLIVAAIALAALGYVGLRSLNTVHDDNVATRLQRASQASSALALERMPELNITFAEDGSPLSYILANEEAFVPGDDWDSLLDTIGGANDGAANLFRFNTETNSFDRLSTTFRTPEGARAGGSAVEPGLLVEGHPAFANLTSGTPFVGQVPVAGRLRLAYLTPVTVQDSDLTGAIAIDVGFVDDINAINAKATSQSLLFGGLLLLATALVGIIVMARAFKPMHRLTEAVNNVGSGELDPKTVQLTERRDEIGYLARGLTKVTSLQDDLQHRATTDSITNIANRTALVDELDMRFANTNEENEVHPFAFMILNLNGFQGVRSALGHQASDEYLAQVAGALAKSLQPGEFVARLNSEEFAVLSEIDSDIAAQADLSERIANAASDVYETSAGETQTKAGIGIVHIPQHATTPAEALRTADLALDEVKRPDRGDTVLYHPNLSLGFDRQLFLLTELRQSLTKEDFSMAYQPAYDRNGKLVAAEALVRWNTSEGISVTPGEFIPVAEIGGLIDEFGMWAITEAASQISRWHEAHGWSPQVWVNVSPLQLMHKKFVDSVADVLAQFPAASEHLGFELTSNSSSQQIVGLRKDVLANLKKLGIRLAIDDFGTDNSPLSNLSDLPIDQINVSGDFAKALSRDAGAAAFLSDIIDLGKGRDLSVAVKGIDSGIEFKLAAGMDYDLLQGFELAKPMPADKVSQLFGVPHGSFAELPSSAS